MRSMHHLSNKITLRFVKYICFFFVISFISNCYGIKSQFAKDESGVFNNKSVCLILRILDNNSRLFKNRFEDIIPTTDYTKCNYVVYVKLIEGYKQDITAVSGVAFYNTYSITAQYNIFKYDNKDTEQLSSLKDVIENPSLLSFDSFVGNKNPSLAKKNLDTKRYTNNYQEEQKSVSGDIKRLGKTLKQIDNGSYIENMSNMSNMLLMTTNTQEGIYSLEQIAKQLAEDVATATTLAVLDDNDDEKNSKNEQKVDDKEENKNIEKNKTDKKEVIEKNENNNNDKK